MRTLRRFVARLRASTRSAPDDARLQAEIDEHLALLRDEYIRAGLTPVEARRQAVLKFGAIEAMKERYRDQRAFPSLGTLIQDTRHALRRLRIAPAFTAATVLTLALGIGATTSMFTVVHAVLLKSLPVARPGELYRLGRDARCCYLSGYSQEREFSLVSYELYEYLRDHTQGFAELAAFPASQPMFGVRRSGGSAAAQGSPGEFVSGNYFAMFGIRPYAGRLLAPADDRDGAPPAAVMTYRVWQQRYGADRSAIGAVFTVNGKPFTLVGITPPGFFGDTLRSTPPDFFLPLNTEPLIESDADLRKHDTPWLALIGRIQSGAAAGAVEAQMRVALRQWLRAHWGEMSAADRARFPEQTLFLSPGGAGITSMRQQYGEWLLILMMATGFVLLIVCANIASLMIVRGIERRRQIALSISLGAPVSRVIREPLLESLLLSVAGGAAGVATAFAATRLLLKLAFPPLSGFAGIPIDAAPSTAVLLFAVAASLATGVAFGIVPAWMASRVDPVEALRGSARVLARSGALPQRALVILQAALSLVLLSAAGLLVASLGHLEHQHVGFEQEGRLVVTMNPRLAGYTAERLSPLYRRIHDSVAAVPGVAAVALCLYSPASGGWGSAVWIDGHPARERAGDQVSQWNRVTGGYFDVVGTRILKGRGVSEQDTATSEKVAVVNEAFARRFFGSEDPIGKRFGRQPDASREFGIVGVAEDARYFTRGFDRSVDPMFFLPEAQAEYAQTNLGSLFLHDIVLVARPGVRVTDAAVREAIASVDPGLPIISIRTLRDQVSSQFAQQRLIAQLTSLFGIVSLVLASVGLYGVTAHNAHRRSSEIGLRMALGATRGQVVRLVLRTAFGLTLMGLVAGLPLTVAVGRLLRSQLYGTSPYDPLVTLTAVVALGSSAIVASVVPAVRASMIAPTDALRAE